MLLLLLLPSLLSPVVCTWFRFRWGIVCARGTFRLSICLRLKFSGGRKLAVFCSSTIFIKTFDSHSTFFVVFFKRTNGGKKKCQQMENEQSQHLYNHRQGSVRRQPNMFSFNSNWASKFMIFCIDGREKNAVEAAATNRFWRSWPSFMTWNLRAFLPNHFATPFWRVHHRQRALQKCHLTNWSFVIVIGTSVSVKGGPPSFALVAWTLLCFSRVARGTVCRVYARRCARWINGLFRENNELIEVKCDKGGIVPVENAHKFRECVGNSVEIAICWEFIASIRAGSKLTDGHLNGMRVSAACHPVILKIRHRNRWRWIDRSPSFSLRKLFIEWHWLSQNF